MAETLDELEGEIRVSLLKEGKVEIVTGGFKIIIKESGQIEINELSLPDSKQLELPLASKPEESK